MRYFEEYCEIHLDPKVAPYTWVFRSDEKIRIIFGVHLSKHPVCGQVAYELNDGQGYCDIDRITAQTEGTTANGFQMFAVVLPSVSNGGGYRYKLGYVDALGNEHTSNRSQFLFVCDEAPRSVTEISSEFLGYVNGRALHGPKPKVSITPSPDVWEKRLFYSIIIDRFARHANSYRAGMSAVEYDPTCPYASHGGTIRGLIEKIGYLKALGVGAIILSPIYVNATDGYHGYHPIHLLMVDPRLGTLECLRELVTEAHKAEIYVILDVVNNHIADSINWEHYGGPPGGEFKYIQGDRDAVMPFPIEARNTSLFHGPKYTDMVNQRLFGFLEDWRTETSYVRELLIQHLKYWISETDIDGLRYDSARHVGLDFWEPCVEEIERYTSYLGKNKFLQIAEHAGSCHEEVIEYNSAKFTNFIDYPTYYNIKETLDNVNWLKSLADYFCGFLAPQQPYFTGWQQNIMFLDNQDTTRIFHQFLSRLENSEDARVQLHFGLACLILGPQIPSIYQGTEQEFSGALGLHQKPNTGEWIGHDCYVREDMFENPACVWQFGPINRPTFAAYSTQHPTFLLIQKLAEIRGQNSVIQTGNRTLLYSGNQGLWCVLIHGADNEQPLFVAMNLGSTQVFEEACPIPKMYGNFCKFNALMTTAGGELNLVEGVLKISLPSFTFVLGRLLS
ncbi:glycosyl hydrolase, involved in Hassallidin biosynthesis [Planktothrix serta PCC 8927]|uniref:Glycosyl hydrolase, involved in Hassallidin biosynthesis n=1 Tax=Planktothrix serta PCC 8927 TaxID=671068 RepID=A0A1J1JMC7_9CYAN|nr:alpha-amylase family glycosyl hydrolase [Planktothrix serta]CZT62793.1 glycosyl hydrolase, involved in Hassallidin biosynthesis [Planktothrix serta PCC 8927]VXD10567.1 glycosyl hydrolase, involved in Hassallidin biosynthesis [Planktothrix serta PCC 8927]